MDRSTIKAVRIAALIHAREQGLLEGHTLDEIARVLAGEGEVPVNRSTIMRNLLDLDEAIALRNRLVERLRNLEGDSTQEGYEPGIYRAIFQKWLDSNGYSLEETKETWCALSFVQFLEYHERIRHCG